VEHEPEGTRLWGRACQTPALCFVFYQPEHDKRSREPPAIQGTETEVVSRSLKDGVIRTPAYLTKLI